MIRKIANNQKITLLLLIVSFICAMICELIYLFPNEKLNVSGIKKVVISKQSEAELTLDQVEKLLVFNTLDTIYNFNFNNSDIFYFLYSSYGEPLFWSSNEMDIDFQTITSYSKWQLIQSSNATCLALKRKVKQGSLVAVIKIKSNYDFENEQFINEFTPDIDLNKSVSVVIGSSKDIYSVFGLTNEYLFSLQPTGNESINKRFAIVGFVVQFVFFLLLFYYLASLAYRKSASGISLGIYLRFFIPTFIILLLLLYLSFPNLLFNTVFSSAYDYSYGYFLKSLTHLTLVTIYIGVAAFVFFKFVLVLPKNSKLAQLGIQLFPAIFYLCIYVILNSLIQHSVISVNMLNVSEITLSGIWLYFILFIWAFSFVLLISKTHKQAILANGTKFAIFSDILVVVLLSFFVVWLDYKLLSRIILFYVFVLSGYYVIFLLKKRLNYTFVVFLWSIIFTIFIVENSSMLNRKKTENKYRVLAENLMINGSNDNDRITEIMLGDLNSQIVNDKFIQSIVHSDSTDILSEYLNDNYFRGYWNKFDVNFECVYSGTDRYNQSISEISVAGIPIPKTNFYTFSSQSGTYTFAGVFPLKSDKVDDVSLIIKFYPRKNFKSFSFPKFLMTNENDIQSNLNIAVAKYTNHKLIFSNGNFSFPLELDFIKENRQGSYFVQHQGKRYFIYSVPALSSHIVIVELKSYNWKNYLFYFVYVLLAYSVLAWLLVWLYRLFNTKTDGTIRFSTRFQIAFVVLLLFSFLGIFYVSVAYISDKYKDQLMGEIDKKKAYVRNALQEKYFWTQDLSTVSKQGLNFDLQDLSNLFQTDINVYDNYGQLAGSSQPLIYDKKLTGRKISVLPFFRKNSNINQEEYIGKLRYLAGYTEFLNGDYLQIGYISIPLYVSNEEIRKEIEDFLSVVVNIYIIIAFLSVLLSFIIGKQLSAPLQLIESKLKRMRFGLKNEKIEYDASDEIGNLVRQYNKTIDELEKSANLLAQTERESAWRTMARQVAHEINNPLTPMKLTIQQLQRTKSLQDDRFDDYFEKSTHTLIEQIDNLSRIAGTFSNFARLPEASFQRFDFARKICSATQLFQSNNEFVEIYYSGLSEEIFVYADPEQMLQVFNNLMKNALQAITVGIKGEIRVNLVAENNYAILTIHDNGKGIPDELKDKVFNPNFTTKNTGMGLGLAISKNIVELAGGEIYFESAENKGTTFTLRMKMEK